MVTSLMSPGLGWWFPGNGLAGSKLGEHIDHLFYLILWITTIVFIGVHAAIGYAVWTAGTRPGDRRAWYSHGNHKLEIIWTVIPGIILTFIAFYQFNVWAEFRMTSQYPKDSRKHLIAEVNARQFEWRIRYPAPGKTLQINPQFDDAWDVNELHIPAGQPVSFQLRTMDVQHSFFLPVQRMKQDAVPGLVIPLWLQTDIPGEYPLVCAELCGWGHYKMGAKLVVHPADEYPEFMKKYYSKLMSDGTQKTETASTEGGSK
jgi:cytochrome c oxidase subunit 2